MSLWATSGIIPDRTYLLLINVFESKKRLNTQTRKPDRIEFEKEDFKEKLKEGYLEIAKRFNKRIISVNADDDIISISSFIKHDILKLLKLKGWIKDAY